MKLRKKIVTSPTVSRTALLAPALSASGRGHRIGEYQIPAHPAKPPTAPEAALPRGLSSAPGVRAAPALASFHSADSFFIT